MNDNKYYTALHYSNGWRWTTFMWSAYSVPTPEDTGFTAIGSSYETSREAQEEVDNLNYAMFRIERVIKPETK